VRGGEHDAAHRGVVAPGELDAAVADWARKLAAKSPLIVRLGKDALYEQQDMDFAEALEFQRAQLTIALSTEDVREGVAAFMERREPAWTGR
jgi:enoyl-CoA hydratase/carnithine racemase